MKKIIPVLAVLAIAITSCQKEESLEASRQGSDISGNWLFVSMSAKTKNTIEYKDGPDAIKSITTSDYTTTSNKGTVVITGDKFISTGVGYNVSTNADAEMYENGVLIMSGSIPFNYTAPASNSQAPYIRVSADSIYFTSGGFVDMGSGGVPSTPVGAKIKLEQNKLTLTMSVQQTFTQDVLGILQKVSNEATVVTTLQRQ